jgi:hypothetical protein
MGFVIWNSPEDVEKFREYREAIADHFHSERLAAAYLDGLIDWNGNEIWDGYDPEPLFE